MILAAVSDCYSMSLRLLNVFTAGWVAAGWVAICSPQCPNGSVVREHRAALICLALKNNIATLEKERRCQSCVAVSFITWPFR